MLSSIFSDVLNFLKFVTDPNAKNTLADILRVVSRTQKNWKKDIKSVKAEFNGNESYTLSVFVNSLLDDFAVVGLSKNKISDFKIVFSELINNAFEHGCRHSEKCKIVVQCVYSRWFIHLQVSDSGKGFDLEKTLEKLQQQTDSNPTQSKHGLQVVKNIAFRVYSNKKGNLIAAVLTGQDNIEVIPATEHFKGKELLIVNIRSDRAWYYIVADWKPLTRIVDSYHKMKLIYINAIDMDWTTKVGESAKTVVERFSETQDRYYAFVVSDQCEDEFELSNLDTDNVKVFRESEITRAKSWLIEKAQKQVKTA